MGRPLAGVNLNLLVALDALFSERSVTRAARSVGVSQPAMSKSLRQLREHFEDPLLVRGSDGLLLTPRAAELRAPLESALEQLGAIVHGRPRFDPAASERLFRVAMPDYLQGLLGASLMKSFVAQAPKASFILQRMDRQAYPLALEQGELDLAVHACLEPPTGLRSTPLVHDRFACAVRRGHPAVRDGQIELTDYVAYPHCLIALSDAISPGSVDVALAERGLKRHVAGRVRSFLAAPLVVAHCDAILTAPERMLRKLLPLTGLEIVPAPLPLHWFAYAMVWHERFEADPANQWLRGVLEDAASEHAPGHQNERDWLSVWGTKDSARRREITRRGDGAVL